MEVSLKPLILKAAFVTGLGKGHLSTWGANKKMVIRAGTDRLVYYITMKQGTRRFEGISVRVIPASRDHTSSETD
jgi:hypothetical protein